MQPPGKNILPIFNKKKRPRQAIFAYPDKAAATEPSSSGIRPNQCFQPANTHATQQPGFMQQSNQPQNRHQFNSTGFQNARKTPSNNASNRSFKGASAGSQPPGFLGQPSPSRTQGNNRSMMKPNQSTPVHRPIQRQQQQHPGQSTYSQRNNQPQYGRGGSSSGKENHQQYRSTLQQGKTFQPNNVSTYPNPSKRQYIPSSTTTSQSRPTAPVPSPTTTGQNMQYGARNGAQSNTFSAASTSKQTVLLPFQGPRTDGTEGTASLPVATKPAPDKTIKILTSSIEGMKHWSQYTDCVGLLLFEMFGILNSAISTDDSATAKMFNLKDGQHSQKCIFYETDRKLQRLTRGQYLRCVGNLDKKTGLFRVVTVRPASEQEQAMSKSIIAKCDQAMNETIAEMQEQ